MEISSVRNVGMAGNSEISALEELKGRCLAINVCYLDTGVRMRPAIECITRHLNEVVKRPLQQKEIDELAEEIYDLREYFKYVMKESPETEKEIKPAIKVINYLIDPV